MPWTEDSCGFLLPGCFISHHPAQSQNKGEVVAQTDIGASFRTKSREWRSIKFVDSEGGKLHFVKKLLDLPTPCLVLDLDRFESNVEKMSAFARSHGVALRPHAKTHKCVNIARR